MNNYLIEILKEENTVILPGFGAFTVVNRATNELMFMSFMKYNDGTLVNFIAKKEGISAEEAKEKIDNYVAEINAAIDGDGMFKLDQIGVFTKDSAGEVQFSPTPGDAAVTAPVVTVVPEPEVIVEIPEEIAPVEEEIHRVEEVPEEIPVPVETINAYEEQVTEEEVEVDEVDVPLVNAEEPVVEIPVVIEENIPTPATEDEQWNDDLDLPPVNYKPERPKQPILEKTKKDKKPRRSGTLILMIIALLVTGGAAYVGFNYKDLKDKIPFLASAEKEVKEDMKPVEDIETPEEPVEEIPEEEVVEEVAEEVAPEVTPEPAKETKPTPAASSANGIRVDKALPIQVIVGSFGEVANANRMVEKLQAQGFPAQIIGVYGGLHTVSVASFNSMDEYKANQSQLQSAGAHWVKK
ncbi:SPOR domain-containing protein [Crocinitomicaceae bacterium CZZ-1]|uniref:SPOR domain-containing protein n=1 Tax=Taishania pollutisoli TaxID=2766479 RepID=A0A8J6U1H0_9FLAO|nr:SPOR domain-containing protein [Taishania pollutisoli]MBC9811110.1 SPOR domain-containing protein [Taishania pollutisoli]